MKTVRRFRMNAKRGIYHDVGDIFIQKHPDSTVFGLLGNKWDSPGIDIDMLDDRREELDPIPFSEAPHFEDCKAACMTEIDQLQIEIAEKRIRVAYLSDIIWGA